MMKRFFLFAALGISGALAVEAPPTIPDGQITYDEVSYQNGASELPAEFMEPSPAAGGYDALALPAVSSPSSTPNTVIDLMLYASNYQVRGMGVTDDLSKYGTSHLYASHTFANKNMFRRGIQHRVHGLAGVIWDASSPLGNIMQFEAGYSIGKEVLPNLLVEVGYNFKRGGLEGLVARRFDECSHRSTQEFVLAARFNDHQKGFFGHAELAASFYGLTGYYVDAEAGYRFTNIMNKSRYGADLEVSAGMAPSFSYWGGGVDGIDAYRIRVALQPFTHGGKLGRDARLSITPWVQCSWTGNNARKIQRDTGMGIADHFQLTVGVNAGYKF